MSERETKTTVNPSVRMQPGGYNNTELITRLVSSSLGENLQVNLPKLQLPVFDGNLQQWQEFWDSYIQSHHSWTADYASSFEVQLFEQSMLKGSALSAIAGIPLTSENYSLVVKLLQERFGRKETIVESLYFKC